MMREDEERLSKMSAEQRQREAAIALGEARALSKLATEALEAVSSEMDVALLRAARIAAERAGRAAHRAHQTAAFKPKKTA